jgi:hypothetical protein
VYDVGPTADGASRLEHVPVTWLVWFGPDSGRRRIGCGFRSGWREPGVAVDLVKLGQGQGVEEVLDGEHLGE